MSGFASITGQPDFVYSDNASFDGTTRGGGLTTNGQLWIGATALPNVRVGSITGSSGITVTNGAGTIDISLSGGGSAVDSIGTQFGTNPITPTAAGLVTINGATVAAGTSPVKSNGTGANTMAIEVQISQALAATDATKIGLCNFNSSNFSVDANGFVGLSGFNCAFSAFLPSSDANVTGDNTLFALGSVTALTELYDIGSNFNTNGTFTAPATGIYSFVMNMYLSGVGAAHNSFGMRLYGGTPAMEYIVSNMNGQPVVINGENVTFNGSCQIMMTAGDTLTSAITVSGGAKTVGMVGFNAGRPSYFTFFSGARIG